MKTKLILKKRHTNLGYQSPCSEKPLIQKKLEKEFPQIISFWSNNSIPEVKTTFDTVATCLAGGGSDGTDILSLFTARNAEGIAKMLTATLVFYEGTGEEGGFFAYPMFQGIRIHQGPDGTPNSVTLIASEKAQSLFGKIEPLPLYAQAWHDRLKRNYKWEAERNERIGCGFKMTSYEHALKTFELLQPHVKKRLVMFPLSILYDFFNIQGKHRQNILKINDILFRSRKILGDNLPFTWNYFFVSTGDKKVPKTFAMLFYMPGRPPVSLEKRPKKPVKQRRKLLPHEIAWKVQQQKDMEKLYKERLAYVRELKMKGYHGEAASYARQWKIYKY